MERLEGLLVGVLGGRGVGRWSMGDACTLVGKLWEGTFWL